MSGYIHLSILIAKNEKCWQIQVDYTSSLHILNLKNVFPSYFN